MIEVKILDPENNIVRFMPKHIIREGNYCALMFEGITKYIPWCKIFEINEGDPIHVIKQYGVKEEIIEAFRKAPNFKNLNLESQEYILYELETILKMKLGD